MANSPRCRELNKNPPRCRELTKNSPSPVKRHEDFAKRQDLSIYTSVWVLKITQKATHLAEISRTR
jgi:hypothetical protein